jgi:hypothetical protein
MLARSHALMLKAMREEQPAKRVEVHFTGPAPARRVECAQGVSEVKADGPILRCLVRGSFQPLLDAVRGYEVVDLHAVSIEPDPEAAPRMESA